jgi:serine/threonine protein phosphatase PrpC
MSLKQKILDDIKAAMKAGEKDRLGVLRMLSAAIKQREVDERIEMDDTQTLAVVEKMIKQRRESIRQYEDGGRPELAGMGTTVAGVSVRPSGLIVFNVGDSRVYRVEDGDLVQLSTDDTPGPKLADGRTAMVTTSQITQCLGGYDEMGIVPHVLAEPMAEARRYLICSDGLSDLLAREAIEARLQADDRATVKALFDAAMDLGGRDNISIILLDLSAQ